jgi:hypothetical protein
LLILLPFFCDWSHTGARALVLNGGGGEEGELFQIPALIDLALSTPHSDTSEGIRFVV